MWNGPCISIPFVEIEVGLKRPIVYIRSQTSLLQDFICSKVRRAIEVTSKKKSSATSNLQYFFQCSDCLQMLGHYMIVSLSSTHCRHVANESTLLQHSILNDDWQVYWPLDMTVLGAWIPTTWCACYQPWLASHCLSAQTEQQIHLDIARQASQFDFSQQL